MNRATQSRKRSAFAAMLGIVLAGCSAMLATTPAWRAARPAMPSAPREMTAAAPAAGEVGPAEKSRIQAAFAKLPLYFVKNGGEADSRVAYYMQGHRTAMYFGSDGVTFALTDAKAEHGRGTLAERTAVRLASTNPEHAGPARWAVKLDFVGANRVMPEGEELTPAVVSYFGGTHAQSSATSPTYRRVVYPELWPGVDLVYTGAGGQLKSTFIVKPGADPARIRLAYRGAAAVRLTDGGQLEVSTPAGSFAEDRPYAYQEAGGHRTDVRMAFALGATAIDGGQGYGFTVGEYDRSQTLVLDPSIITYTGYIGGADDDVANGIAVDSAGNAYVVGTTASVVPSFPAKVGPDLTYGGGFFDVFVAKIKADGSDLVYLGYVGGAGDEWGNAIAVDALGNAYVTGWTTSDAFTFPVTMGPSLHYSGSGDAFVAKIKADGTALVYCGYIGGTQQDIAYGIAVDKNGNAYVAGKTFSDEATFPVKVGPSLVQSGGFDGFVAKVKADGTGLVYAGFIGGSDDDTANAIAVDAAGNAYVAGFTYSDQLSFPVKVGPDLNFNGDTDAFVAKVKADGTGLVYAGYIGGAGGDNATAIAVDALGNAYVTGSTTSDQTTLPVKVGPGLSYHGTSDAFVGKVKSDGSGLVYLGYIGGTGTDGGRGIAVDTAGNAYVTGFAVNLFSLPPGLWPSAQTSSDFDPFVAKVKADGSALLWLGFLGGSGTDFGNAVAVDASGNVYVAGQTYSSDLPVTGGPDLIANGGSDAFVAKLSGKPDLIEYSMGVANGWAKPGGTLSVINEVPYNAGLGTSPISTTRYYLSKKSQRTSADILLQGNRSVPSLLPGQSISLPSMTVTIPTTTPPGNYFVIGCTDDAKAIAEVNEDNNCNATAAPLQIVLPNLQATAVSDPPFFARPGDKFSVTDTVQNLALPVPATTTRYYLSFDTVKGTGDILLGGSRAIPALAAWKQPGDHSTGSATVTIPATTPVGVYHVLACADDVNVVKEQNEDDDCIASAGIIAVTLPDLRTTAASTTASTVKRGHTLPVSDSVKNVANVSAGASTTRYYLSKDTTVGGDVLLTGSRSVPSLGSGGTSTGATTVTVPSTMATGVYNLFACADDLKTVKEISDTNNCAMASSTITVTQ